MDKTTTIESFKHFWPKPMVPRLSYSVASQDISAYPLVSFHYHPDRCDTWQVTLAIYLDRSWWHHYTRIKIFWLQPTTPWIVNHESINNIHHTPTKLYAQAWIHTHIHRRLYSVTHTNMHVHTYTYVFSYPITHTHSLMYVCTHKYACMHTHTQTELNKSIFKQENLII